MWVSTRADAVYLVHFKANKRRIVDYPNMWGYVRDMYVCVVCSLPVRRLIADPCCVSATPCPVCVTRLSWTTSRSTTTAATPRLIPLLLCPRALRLTSRRLTIATRARTSRQCRTKSKTQQHNNTTSPQHVLSSGIASCTHSDAPSPSRLRILIRCLYTHTHSLTHTHIQSWPATNLRRGPPRRLEPRCGVSKR